MAKSWGLKTRIAGLGSLVVFPLAAMVLFQNFSSNIVASDLDQLRSWDPDTYFALNSIDLRLQETMRSNVCPAVKLEAAAEVSDAQLKIFKQSLLMSRAPLFDGASRLLASLESNANELASVNNSLNRKLFYVVDLTVTGAPPATPTGEQAPLKIKLTGAPINPAAPNAMSEISLLIVDNTMYPRGPLRLEITGTAGSPVVVSSIVALTRDPVLALPTDLPLPYVRQMQPPSDLPLLTSSSAARVVLAKALALANEPCVASRVWSYRRASAGNSFSLNIPVTNPIPLASKCDVMLLGSAAQTSSWATEAGCRNYAQAFARALRPANVVDTSGIRDFEVRYQDRPIPQYEELKCEISGTPGVMQTYLMPSPAVLDCLRMSANFSSSADPKLALRFGTTRLLAANVCSVFDATGKLLGSKSMTKPQDCPPYAESLSMQVAPNEPTPTRWSQVYFGFRRMM